MAFAARWVTALALLVAAVGCQAEVATTIDTNAADAATVAVTFDGEAAQVMQEAPWRDELIDVLTTRSGTTPDDVTANETEESFRVEVTTTVEAVTAASGLTGISQVSVTPDGASIELRTPHELDEALIEGVAGQPDADALLAALRAGTTVGVSIKGDGTPEVAFTVEDGQPEPVAEPLVDEGRVWFGQPLSRFSQGTLAVTFTQQQGGSQVGIWIVGVATGGALLWWAHKRDRKRKALEEVGWI